MPLFQFESQTFQGVEDQERLVREWRGRYDKLLGDLGLIGSEVKVNRVLEKDRDIPPYQFVRNAVHEFIFPPQPDLRQVEDKSGVTDSTPGYELTREERAFEFDPEAARTHLRIAYDDSDSRVAFQVDGVDGKSILPEPVAAVIAAAFIIRDTETATP